MASRRPTKKKGRGRRPSAFSDVLRLPRLPHFDEQQLDLIGLGLVALAAFFAFVFYLGWNGGKVGETLGDGFIYLFGGVGYLVPIAMFGAGAVLVLRQVLPSVRPFKAGSACLLGGLMLGLAARSFGIGPAHPARHGYFKPEYFKHHGGAVGDAMYAVTKTLIQQFGTDILFLFLMAAGILLLTGASLAGIVRATGESLTTTTRRVRQSTHEFAAIVSGKPAEQKPAPPALEEDKPPEVEPVVRATHVEAPALDGEPEADALESELGDDVAAGVAAVRKDAQAPQEELTPMGNKRSAVTEADEDAEYTLPNPSALKRSNGNAKVDTSGQERTAKQLVEALGHFGVEAQVVGTVTGKQAVGVEVPNQVRRIVHLGDVYQEAPKGWSPLTVWLGKDIAGQEIGTDLAKQPHVLVAGTTGSGKSGCVNAMLCSILLRQSPNDVRLVLVDPKHVELNHYEHIPHLLTPVVTSPRLAANVLTNLIKEMEERYSIMSRARTRNLVELNRVREKEGERPLPYILCVIDELADLMMIAPGEVEDSIIRLAQKSRAVGIHLLLATQRPSADIITGMIKANVPARIAFAVSSQTDSRVILDQNGAESLLGQGDMLFRPASESRAARIQGAFITEDEIEKLTNHWREQGEPELHEELLEAIEGTADDAERDFDPDSDDLLGEAIATVVQLGSASTSMLQRRLRIGYTRAGRLIDMMQRRGVISGYEGSKARQVLITEGDLPRVLDALDEPVGAPSE